MSTSDEATKKIIAELKKKLRDAGKPLKDDTSVVTVPSKINKEVKDGK
jgi:hypothetical protein